MTSYGLKTNVREKATCWLVLLSVIISYLLYNLIDLIVQNNYSALKPFLDGIKKIEYLGIISIHCSALTIYGLIKLIYNKLIWKAPIIRCWHKVPNLNGKWTGELTSSYQGKKMIFSVNIKQSWNKILVHCIFDHSESISDCVTIKTEGNSTWIIYTYENEIKENTHGSVPHKGVMELRMMPDSQLVGDYYTQRNPSTHGHVRLMRQDGSCERNLCTTQRND